MLICVNPCLKNKTGQFKFICRTAKNLDYKTYFSYNPLRRVLAYLAYYDVSPATASQRKYKYASASALGMDDNALRKNKSFKNSRHFKVNMKGKKLNLVGRVLLGIATVVATANASRGYLETQNYIGPSNTSGLHCMLHYEGMSEGLDGQDTIYGSTLFGPGINSKIVSIISGYELMNDARPLDNNSIDLELALISQSGNPITVSNLENELRFEIDPEGTVGDFGNKPITYWEPNDTDPNIYHLVANVRKEILQNSGVVPLPNLDGTYQSEEVYLRPGIRFDVYDTDLHEDGDNIINFKDYAIFADNWKRKGITDSNRADPGDPGAWADFNLDGQVDYTDLDFLINDLWEYDAPKIQW